MQLASMLQVNVSLQELEVASCDLVNTHRGLSIQFIIHIL